MLARLWVIVAVAHSEGLILNCQVCSLGIGPENAAKFRVTTRDRDDLRCPDSFTPPKLASLLVSLRDAAVQEVLCRSAVGGFVAVQAFNFVRSARQIISLPIHGPNDRRS
jgi:hypothetical protein